LQQKKLNDGVEDRWKGVVNKGSDILVTIDKAGTLMKLFASHTSPYARKVRVVLIEKRLECELIPTDVSVPNNPSLEFNPLGKVPVLVLDDGTPVHDSAVITEYLDTVTPVGSLIPDDARPRMLVKRWEAIADGLLDAGVLLIMESRRPQNERSPAWIERQYGKIQRALQQMSDDLGERNFCFGESFSLADAAVGSALFFLDFRFPNIAWREHRKSFEETQPPASMALAQPPAIGSSKFPNEKLDEVEPEVIPSEMAKKPVAKKPKKVN
jgi:glutathione S-transferase